MDVIRYNLNNDIKGIDSGLAWHCENDNYPNVITLLSYKSSHLLDSSQNSFIQYGLQPSHVGCNQCKSDIEFVNIDSQTGHLRWSEAGWKEYYNKWLDGGHSPAPAAVAPALGAPALGAKNVNTVKTTEHIAQKWKTHVHGNALDYIPAPGGEINANGEAKFTGEVRFNEQWLTQPLTWKRPRRIFVAAHGGLFADGVKDEWLDRIFAVMALSGKWKTSPVPPAVRLARSRAVPRPLPEGKYEIGQVLCLGEKAPCRLQDWV